MGRAPLSTYHAARKPTSHHCESDEEEYASAAHVGVTRGKSLTKKLFLVNEIYDQHAEGGAYSGNPVYARGSTLVF